VRSLLISVVILSLGGCQAVKRLPFTQPVDPTPVVEAFKERDATVLGATERIDVTVKATPYEAPVKVETNSIREAVAKSSALDVATLATSFMGLANKLQERIHELETQLDEERTRALRSQSDKLNWAGLGFLALFGLSFFAGPAAALKTWPLAILGGGCLALSQIVSSPWFARGGAVLIAVALGYSIWWVYDRHKEGRLKESLSKRVDLFKRIIPVIDSANDEARAALKGAFKEAMSAEDKAEILVLKSELTRAPSL
jgi:hypothetical protein